MRSRVAVPGSAGVRWYPRARGGSVSVLDIEQETRHGGGHMGTNRELHERALEAFNTKDEAGIRATCSKDVEYVAPGGMTGKGIDAYLDFCRSWWTAFPDGKALVQRLHVTDDALIEEAVFAGTHRGVLATPMGDIPPTGRRLEGRYTAVYAVSGGRITSDHLVFDRMELMEQLGLVPAAAEAG